MNEQIEEFLVHRNVKAFVSSTFQDLDEERTYLVKYIFPRIVDYCEARYISFHSIDLRWGITAEQDLEKDIVKVCFDEIDYSSPFFIGIVGGRYGWIPQLSDFGSNLDGMCRRAPWLRSAIQQGKSITEIEFLYGALMQNNNIAACFYLKDGIQVEDAAAEFRARIMEQKKVPVRLYATVEQLGEMVYDDITKRIEYLFSTIEDDKFHQQKMRHEYALSRRTNRIIAFPKETLEMLNQWHESKSDVPLIISEKAPVRNGSTIYTAPGKSTLLCYYTVQMRKQGIDVIYYDTQEYYDSHVSCIEDIINYVNQSSEELSHNNEIIIAIDNFDFEMNEEFKDLWTQTLLNLQSRGHVIVSSRGSACETKIELRIMNCPESSKDVRSKIIDLHTAQYGKKLTTSQKERILSSHFSENLNDLIYLLNTLIGFGSYEDLDKEINWCCKCSHSLEFLVRDIKENIGNMNNNQWEAMWILNAIALTETGGLTEQEIIDLLEKAGIAPLKWAKIRNRVLQLCHKIGNVYTIYDSGRIAMTILRDYYFTNFRDLVNEQMREYFAKHKVHPWRYAQIIPALYANYLGVFDADKEENYKSEYKSVFLDVELVNYMPIRYLYDAWAGLSYGVGGKPQMSMKNAPANWILREELPTYSATDIEKYYLRMASVSMDLDRNEDYEICMRRLQNIWNDEFKIKSAEIDILLFNGKIHDANKLCNSCKFSDIKQAELKVKVLRAAFETSDDLFFSDLPSMYNTLLDITDKVAPNTDLYYDVKLLCIDLELFVMQSLGEFKLEKLQQLKPILEQYIRDLCRNAWRDKRVAEISRLLGYISMMLGDYKASGMFYMDRRVMNDCFLHGDYSVQCKRALLEYGLSCLTVKHRDLGNKHIRVFFNKRTYLPDFRMSRLCNPWIINALMLTNRMNDVYPTYRDNAYLKLQQIQQYMVSDKNNSHNMMLLIISKCGYKFPVPFKTKLKWAFLFLKFNW
jgi:hypothetical protein